MEDIGIGKLIISPRQKDAIHIAVAPVEAGIGLKPGQMVRLLHNSEAFPAEDVDYAIGIVDPFLQTLVQAGEKFWLFLFPGSIKSIRHEWEHPAFGNSAMPEINLQAKAWLEVFAQRNNTDLEDILRAAEKGWTSSGNGISVPDEFWIQYRLYTGRTGNVTDYFSCSC